MSLVAVDIAILPPPTVTRRAIDLSAALPLDDSQGLLLGPEYLPHVTLTQQFVRTSDLDALLARVGQVLLDRTPLSLRVTAGALGTRTVWLAIEPSRALRDIHERLLATTKALEQDTGDATAFFGGDARDRDVNWVSGFRTRSSFDRFTPHITLGHAARPPVVDPFDFEASTIAACHLGRFCSCRRVLRAWELSRPD